MKHILCLSNKNLNYPEKKCNIINICYEFINYYYIAAYSEV